MFDFKELEEGKMYRVVSKRLGNVDLREIFIDLLRTGKVDLSLAYYSESSSFDLCIDGYEITSIPTENLLDVLGVEKPEGCIKWYGLEDEEGIILRFLCVMEDD